MIHQLNIEGKDKVEVAIERIQDFATLFKSEADQGYYLAFSGGKDSVVVKRLLDMAGVKYDAHYQITSVDPPELVRFIKKMHPDVSMDRMHWEKDGRFHKAGDPITMWNLIPEKLMPPTMLVRYCCEVLKESGGDGRLTVTGGSQMGGEREPEEESRACHISRQWKSGAEKRKQRPGGDREFSRDPKRRGRSRKR